LKSLAIHLNLDTCIVGDSLLELQENEVHELRSRHGGPTGQ
jgi:hypothetical protein